MIKTKLLIIKFSTRRNYFAIYLGLIDYWRPIFATKFNPHPFWFYNHTARSLLKMRHLQWGNCKTRKIFSHENKNWFTVFASVWNFTQQYCIRNKPDIYRYTWLNKYLTNCIYCYITFRAWKYCQEV